MGLENYDNWKLDNGEVEGCQCEGCDEVFRDEEDVQEYSWRDADFDKQTKFLCDKCIERIQDGGV